MRPIKFRFRSVWWMHEVVEIDLKKYAKKLGGIIIDKTVMMDQIFDVIISDEDRAKVFFLISEKLRETGEEYLSLIKKRSWKN